MNKMMLALAAACLLVPALHAQVYPPTTIHVPSGLSYQGQITLAGLGVIPYPSAIEFSPDGLSLYISGAGNTPAGLIYRHSVIRQPGTNRILGFGVGVPFAPAPYIDAGLQFGPNGVLFFTEFPTNKLGEIVNGVLYEFPLPPETQSTGGLVFIPAGLPNAGTLLCSNWSTGGIYAIDLVPNANGSFTPTTATLYATTPVIYGEGMRFVPVGPHQGDLLLADFNAPNGRIHRYDIDPSTGIPVGGASAPAVSDLITDFPALDGIAFDPITHDLFVTDWLDNALFRFTGFTTMQTLVATPTTLPVGGGTIQFDLRAGSASALFGHILAASASGTSPGTAIGAITVPLNIDILTIVSVEFANTSLFANFYSAFNTTGESMAALQVPPNALGPAVTGLSIDFAYIVQDWTQAPYAWTAASNAVTITIVP